jgi:hypothetical protein
MHNYKSETQLDLDPDFRTFFEDFYATSDTPEAHEHYVKYFTEDATVIMASKKVKGSDGSWPPLNSAQFPASDCDSTYEPVYLQGTLGVLFEFAFSLEDRQAFGSGS